jgi:hypothetical protein
MDIIAVLQILGKLIIAVDDYLGRMILSEDLSNERMAIGGEKLRVEDDDIRRAWAADAVAGLDAAAHRGNGIPFLFQFTLYKISNMMICIRHHDTE